MIKCYSNVFVFKIKKAYLRRIWIRSDNFGSRGSNFSTTGPADPDPGKMGPDPQHWLRECLYQEMFRPRISEADALTLCTALRGDHNRYPSTGDHNRYPPTGDHNRYPPTGDHNRYPPTALCKLCNVYIHRICYCSSPKNIVIILRTLGGVSLLNAHFNNPHACYLFITAK